MEHVFSKNVGLGFIRGKMIPKHDSINQLKISAAAVSVEVEMLLHSWPCHSTEKTSFFHPKSKSVPCSSSVIFRSPGSISCTLISTHSFQSMSDPSRVPAMHPASPQNLLNPFPLCVSCRLHAPIWPFILWEWKGCRMAWLLTPIVGTSNSSDISGRLYWIGAWMSHPWSC